MDSTLRASYDIDGNGNLYANEKAKAEALAAVKAQPPQGPIVIDPSNLRTGMLVFITMTDGGRAILVDCIYHIRRKKSGAFTLIPAKQKKGGQRARSSR